MVEDTREDEFLGSRGNGSSQTAWVIRDTLACTATGVGAGGGPGLDGGVQTLLFCYWPGSRTKERQKTIPSLIKLDESSRNAKLFRFGCELTVNTHTYTHNHSYKNKLKYE